MSGLETTRCMLVGGCANLDIYSIYSNVESYAGDYKRMGTHVFVRLTEDDFTAEDLRTAFEYQATMTAKAAALDEFVKAVDQSLVEDRGQHYGAPEDNHLRTATLWNAYVEAQRVKAVSFAFDATDVCYFNILQKMSRDMHGTDKPDTLEDIIGYAENLQMMRGQHNV